MSTYQGRGEDVEDDAVLEQRTNEQGGTGTSLIGSSTPSRGVGVLMDLVVEN